ncbi:MAG: Dabb family protein [Pseudomonadota bacterium]
MIRHIVLTKFANETSEATIAALYDDLSALVAALPGARSFTGGRSASPEELERGYKHGFVIDFDSWEALGVYAENPEHKALGARLVAHAAGGKDGILVLDLEI